MMMVPTDEPQDGRSVWPRGMMLERAIGLVMQAHSQGCDDHANMRSMEQECIRSLQQFTGNYDERRCLLARLVRQYVNRRGIRDGYGMQDVARVVDWLRANGVEIV